MTRFFTGVFENTPIWVWPLFFMLLWIGLRSSHRRRIPIVLFYFFPFMIFINLNSFGSFSYNFVVWGSACISYLAGGLFGYRLQQHWTIELDGRYVEIKGEWLTMFAVMLLFFSNFVLGMGRVVFPDFVQTPWFEGGYVALCTFASGFFGGRAFMILVLVLKRGKLGKV